ncbi:MAG: phage baseplate assembly protein V [Acidobacteriota bacterium]
MKLHDDNHIMLAEVVDLVDPEDLGRVRVKYVNHPKCESDFARLVPLMAGPEIGTFFRPDVGDEVLVTWEHGDRNRPYILGGLWSKVCPPPPDDGKPEENNWRFIVSRSGHVLKFDDTKGAERIEIFDKDHKLKIFFDSTGDKLELIADSGDIDVKANTGKVKVEALNVELKATANIRIEAAGEVTIKGSTVNIN